MSLEVVNGQEVKSVQAKQEKKRIIIIPPKLNRLKQIFNN